MSASGQYEVRKTAPMARRTCSSEASTGQPIVNELDIVGLIETMMILRES